MNKAVVLFLLLGSGCLGNPSYLFDSPPESAGYADDDDTGTNAGGDGTVISLPFAAGDSSRCTQGTGGSYSHSGDSTAYGLDLDTPNDSDMELYAPISGIARVHTESATSGFGYHLSVGIAEDLYVVMGHMREIDVTDGSEVTAGQFVGYEGCTGTCTGDHVHLSLMEGDAAQMAQFADSADALVRAEDMDLDDPEFQDIRADDFVCGSSDGHVYASDLPVPLWHPDGTLVKVPNDPKVYVVEDGLARHVANESVFWSYNWDFTNLILISDEELACFGTGDEIGDEGSVRAGYDSDGDAWLLVRDQDNDAWKWRLPDTGADEVLASWGISSGLGSMDDFSEGELDDYTSRSGTALFRDGSILKESGHSDVYVVSDGIALPVETWDAYLLLGFGPRDIIMLDDGEVRDVMGDNVGSCAAGIWCLDRESVTACGGGLEFGSGADLGGEEPGDVSDADDPDDDSSEDPAEDTAEDTDPPVEEEEPLDSDGDGVPDSEDNCPWHDNGDQGDADNDGIGDSCDLDADNDGVSNGDDCDMFDPAVGECPSDTGGVGGAEGDGSVVEETDEDSVPEEEPADEDVWTDYLLIAGDGVCFSADGFAFPYDGADAYMVGYGGRDPALDFTLKAEFRLSNADGEYCIDTSVLDFDDYEATLVSSLTSSGKSASSYADTGDWWDNYKFCTSGSETADQFCAYQGGWDYLVAFSVTTSGAFPNGDAIH